MNSASKGLFVQYFKWISPICTLILAIHVGFLLVGITLPFTECLVDSSLLGGLLMVISSTLFDMCRLHKAGVWYTIATTACIEFQRWVGFGVMLTPMRWIMFIIGVILIILFILKYVRTRFKFCTSPHS